MKIKVSEASGPVLDWMVANGGAVYQYKNANLPTGPKVGRSLNAKASG